jgi:hypothetical protein
MADIFHCLRMNASADDVFRAVTEESLIEPWWARESPLSVRCMEVTEGAHVWWRCIDGPEEWIGTDIVFAFAREGSETVVRFAHKNWRTASDTFARCTTKWGCVLLALKSRVETPDADDVRV